MNAARARRLIRELTRQGKWLIPTDAQESMVERCVVPEDVRSVLVGAETCHAEPPDAGCWRGRMAGGDPLKVVVELLSDVVVVTMFRGDEP